jgi:hypothetical protein
MKGVIVNSSIGKMKTDSDGSPISGSRMDASQAYAGIPSLLQRVINQHDDEAWVEIVRKIDNIHTQVGYSLVGLDRETGFVNEVRSQVRSAKKVVFKPNLVGPMVINPETHGEDLGAPICTDWSVIAALMRWFHDTVGITYHQMALGEASTSAPIMEVAYSHHTGRKITSEAVFEGRSGDFYGGWGFYFVRRYLSNHHPPSHTDDPMSGYEDSVAGRYLPPCKATDRLMVYDLNKLADDPTRGRTVPVPNGANYSEVTLHKVVIGGDPNDATDFRNYPGCVLINVPKMKMHAQDLLTNAVKNLGIGLYPIQCAANVGHGRPSWKYAFPSTAIPTYKGKLPHMPWVVEIDETTDLPIKDEKGAYIARKTAGMPGTQADIIRAVQNQRIFMVHVSDSINMINLSHNPEGIAVRIPEGYIWASLDCVALDLFTARYCLKTVPMKEGLRLKETNGWTTEFIHYVPVARVEGKAITTGRGFDSPLFRYNLYKYTEARGVGRQQYYVTGWDSVTETPLASLAGHLGRIQDGNFVELMTETMYYNLSCMLYGMQKTILSYVEANDRLTGSSILKEFMDAFDENRDGIIDYDEYGRKGLWTPGFSILARALDMQITSEYGKIKGHFYQHANLMLRHSNKDWNPNGHDFTRELLLANIASVAFNLSRAETIGDDSFVPGLKWGRGMWPSWKHAEKVLISGLLYGGPSPGQIALASMYGDAFQYSDKTSNDGKYTGDEEQSISNPQAITAYFDALSKGQKPLDFTLYVPKGYRSLENMEIPNVEETDDKAKIFTAHFTHEQEIW